MKFPSLSPVFHRAYFSLIALAIACIQNHRASAAVPPAEKLLPADTLVLVTVPDYSAAKKSFDRISLVQLWHDDSMRAFREKFVNQFKEKLLADQERKMGIKLDDYLALPQGQVTLAVVRNGWDGKNAGPNWVFLMDSKDKSADLAKRLGELKQKWNEQGRKSKVDKIRDIEFTTLFIPTPTQPSAGNRPRVQKQAADAADENQGDAAQKEKPQTTELIFGQADSLLIAGDNAKVIEKILVRLSGGAIATIGEDSAFESNQDKLLRDAVGYAWINVSPFVDLAIKNAAAQGPQVSPLAPSMDKILRAAGLTGLKTICLNINDNPDGTVLNVFATIPESQRRGIFKILALEQKETAPPAFVPADVVKFSRWRINGQKAWSSLEATIQEVSPQISALVQMSLSAAGKDTDPNFDIKKALIANLGDDVISYEKPSRDEKGDEGPELWLIGSANADQLVLGVKAVTGLMPPPTGGTPAKAREFLGRKIYSVPLAPKVAPDTGKMTERNMSFVSANGYVALSEDDGTLEEFVRNSDTGRKPLRELPSLNETAQKVGGLSGGFFGYENYTALIRAKLEQFRTDPHALDNLFSIPGAGFGLGGKTTAASAPSKMKELIDPALIPAFDKIAKYFTYSIYSLFYSADGLNFKLYYPTPPALRQ